MSNYIKDNLIPIPVSKAQKGALAIKVGDEVFIAGGTNTNDATATSNQILEGATAYVKGEKITGNIKTVTPSLTNNKFTVNTGYVNSTELTVPLSNVVETETQVTVSKGYIPENKTFDIVYIQDVNLPQVSVTPDVLLKGETAINSNGNVVHGTIENSQIEVNGRVVTITPGYVPEGQEFTAGPDLSEVTVTPDKMLKGVKALNEDGELISGNIETVSLKQQGYVVSIDKGYTEGGSVTVDTPSYPDASVSVNKNIVNITSGLISEQEVVIPSGSVVKEGIYIKISEGYVESGKITLSTVEPTLNGNVFKITEGYVEDTYELTVPEANINEDENSVQIGVGYIPESFTIEKGSGSSDVSFGVVDENGNFQPLNAESAPPVANGSAIQGTFYSFETDRSAPPTESSPSGGSGSFAKITEFIAPYDAFSAVSSIQVSGFGVVETWNGDIDYSDWNGTYEVTAATFLEGDLKKRIFKKSGAEKYFYYIDGGEWDGGAWGFHEKLGASYATDAEFYAYNLQSGSWYNYNYEINVSLTINQVNTNYPAQPLVLEAVSASYDNGTWSFGTAVTLTEYDKEPAIDGIYLYNGTKLIGDVVDLPFEKWMPTDGLLMYFPLTEKGNTVYDRVSKIRLTKVGTVVQDGTKQDNAGDSGGFVGTQNAFALPKNFTLSVKVNYTGHGTDGNKCVVDFGRGYSGFGIRADLSSDTVNFGLRIGNDSPRQINNIPRDEEHTITFTFEGNTDSDLKDCHAYVDGEERTNMTYEPGTFDQSAMLEILTRYFEGNEVWASFPGTIRDVLLYDRILTAEEIAAIANR